jgi:hypothetical protein
MRTKKIHELKCSVADPGCLSRIRIFPFRIPDQNFSIPDPGFRVKQFRDPGSASKNLSIFNSKTVSKLSQKLARMFIAVPDPDFVQSRIRIPDPGVKKHRIPDIGSGSAKNSTEMLLIAVFNVQGADGDNFYVVESGLFGVLVDTGN